ncbi:translation initiation factor III [Krasilnikovia sp. MM14-A1004]|uniref:translation initiation factor III n=1 Tax=Krasilnikovia sp. MM14-A1004 TaxID=3373541 RepID=UPI00399CEA21
MDATGGPTPPSKITIATLAVSILLAIWAAAMLTPVGRVLYVYVFAYLEYYMGVLTLVSLSITIMLGLVSTDRLVLSIRQRVLLQSAHRTFGVIAVGALGVHLWAKLMEKHIQVIDMFIPFLNGNFFVGFGTISGIIMALVLWTGIARARFIGRGKPWMWRSVHASSYLMWPLALVHGLNAGRPAAVWVIVSYVVCVLMVVLGLAVRVSVSLNRKKDFASQSGTSTGTMKPVGKLAPSGASGMKKRRDSERSGPRISSNPGLTETAVLEPWVPAAPAPAAEKPAAKADSAAPTKQGSRSEYDEEVYRRETRSRRGADEEDRAPRGRREDEYDAPRSRRHADADEPARRPAAGFDEETRAMSRRAIESSGRRRFEDEEPAPRSRRRTGEQEQYEPPRYERTSRAGRYAEDEPAPRQRRAIEAAPAARGWDAGDEPRRASRGDDEPRGRRYADEPTRGRRLADDDGYADERPRRADRWADPGYSAGPPEPRSTRYSDDPSPAPRSRRDRGDRGADVDRADSGRHSRSEFVDLGGPQYDRRPWGPDMEPDETPTLVDMASRRARRAEQPESSRGTSRGARRGRGRSTDDVADDQYWRQLRGEAQ